MKVVHSVSLNPCFNGRYSQRAAEKRQRSNCRGLNPCFNGRYSQRAKTYVPLYTSILGMFKLLETLSLTQINSFLFGCKFTNNFQDVKDRCVKYSLRNSTFSFAKRVLLVLSLRRIMCYANEL